MTITSKDDGAVGNRDVRVRDGQGPDNMSVIRPRLVVTNILLHQDQVLLLKRSQKVRTFRGRWGGCSGHVEADETVEQASYKEIQEETGFKKSKLQLLARGEPVLIERPHGAWLIHPFLYATDSTEVRLDWEHSEFRWVRPEEVEGYDAVPGLYDVIRDLLAARETKPQRWNSAE